MIDDNLMLKRVVDFVIGGKPMDSDSQELVTRFLSNHQAKVDFVQVGLLAQQLSRLNVLDNYIKDLETELFGEEGEKLKELEGADQVKLYKTILREFRDTSNHLNEKATKPSVSSPETMGQLPSPTSTEETFNQSGSLPPSSRENVRSLIERLTNHRVIEMEKESVDQNDDTES